LIACLTPIISGVILYVGTESASLYVCDFDPESGRISLKYSTKIVSNPSFLAVHYGGQIVFTVSEVGTFNNVDNSGGIASYKIDRQNGNLTLIGKPVLSLGSAPTHISLDRSQQWVGIANYNGGNYGLWKVSTDFSLAEKPTTFIQDHGKGPMPQQDGPHAHEFVFNYRNDIAVIPNLGTDTWNVYSFNELTGELSSPSPIKAPAGSGPRHFAFHHTLPYAYGVSEIASTVTVFKTGQLPLQQLQVVHTLPSEVNSWAAELQFSEDGRVLYVSNRYVNANGTIAIFRIDQSTGLLTNIGYAGTLGVYPRFFTLSRSGRFVLIANQNSGDIKVFTRNAATGEFGNLVGSVSGLDQPSHILELDF